MKIILFSALVFASSSSVQLSAHAADGAALYNKNCTTCHGSEVFTRPDRRVKDFTALKKQVTRCSYALETRWFDDEVRSVTDFLNSNYYKF